MARKSPFSDLKRSSIKQRSSRQNDVFSAEWLTLPKDNLANTLEVDLTTLYYFGCNRNNHQIEERMAYVRKIAKAAQNKMKDGRAVSTISSAYFSFVVYIKFCDFNGLLPFSKEGYLAYAGDDGELRRKIKLNDEIPLFLFDMDDGAGLGVTESTAKKSESCVRMYLRMSGCYIESWKDEHDQFTDEERKLTIPYNTDDTDNALTILMPAFDKLYDYLKNGNSTRTDFNPTLPTIVHLSDKLGSLHIKGLGKTDNPFNLCMSIGYALFAYYTAMNRGVILRAAHPIQFEKRLAKEKSVKYVNLSLWKTRAGKFVETFLTDDTCLVDVNESEFDINIEKRTGVILIEKQVSLGEMFGRTEKGSPLFFHLDTNNSPVKFKTESLIRVSQLLDIRVNDTTPVAHILHTGFHHASNNLALSIKRNSRDDGVYLSKKVSVVKRNKAHREAISCAAGLLVAYNKPEVFYGALLPLSYSSDDDGNVIATFNKKDGAASRITMPSEYKPFLKELEAWAFSVSDSRYLLPFPQDNGLLSYKWTDDKRIPSIHTTIRLLAIPPGSFYLDLTAKRFRALTAKLEYNDEDFGFNASVVLGNTIGTFDAAYANGDPEQNQLITYQALEIASRLFQGDTKEDAIQKVKESLKIDVLEFDEYKKSKTLHINQNGTACNGKCDINKDITSDTHRSTAKRAKNLGVGDGDITCYQFDQCCFCKSAKLVNDVNQVYKTLSFIQILEDRADLRPDDDDALLKKATYFRLLVQMNIDDEIVSKAEERLILEGLHPLTQSMQIAQIMI
ncbi:hypothetical protein [Moritella sp.]|uniref:hypothetical protein n=1 Tax=Moritella sp. TaxID=78556 RepID=UPI001D20066F|nr:hypothetical protein [Moritella sp.]MCJ8352108.1 hypothetical protein [Moritella sp.]NQZ42214.1 hypothetical protein [Moritella sp.]